MAEPRTDTKTYLGADGATLQKSCADLQVILANTIFMQQVYKKYHWHVAGPDFYQYHLLFDKHADEQLPLIDAIAERIRTLGGIAPGMPEDVVHNASIHEGEDPGSDAQAMVQSLLKLHDAYIRVVRKAAASAADNGDDGTNDLLVSEVLRTHELQTWFVRSSLAK
jgi:starvation-inducible DNA-binding protein